mgnify:FL=1
MKAFLHCFALLCAFPSLAFGASLRVVQETPVQGDPVMVVLNGADISSITSLTFSGKKVDLFLYQSKPTALIPIDLGARTGAYTLFAKLKNGTTLTKTVTVLLRPRRTAPLGIPDKLGGNTKTAQTNLVTVLARENAVLSKIKTTLPPWWGSPFTFPLGVSEVVDAYGYSRSTGSYFISHKGTDFRADIGTPVLAVNNGIVRMVREFIVYGKTVGIDHGGGAESLSMHLSRVDVKEGQKVKRGQTIGLSGDSGYALGPHLHLSVRIGGISIDPMKFFALFQ